MIHVTEMMQDRATKCAATVHYDANDRIWMEYKGVKGRESTAPLIMAG